MGDVLTTLHDVDPAFRELVGLLYKAGPGPDGSELHAPGSHGGHLRRRRRHPPSGQLTPVDKALRPFNPAKTAEFAAHARRMAALKENAATLGVQPGDLLASSRKLGAKLDRKTARAAAAGKLGRAGAEQARGIGEQLVHNVRTALGPVPEKVAPGKPGPRIGRIAAASAAAGGGAGAYAVHRNRQPQPQLYRQPAVAKSGDELASVTWTGTISKVDTDKRQVFGFCSVSEVNGQPVIDLQGDWVPIEEVEKAAYTYMLASRAGGDMHKRVNKGGLPHEPGEIVLDTQLPADQPLRTGEIIESFVVTPEKLNALGLPQDSMPLGWWLGFQVHDDDAWAAIKSGRRTGFSLHGTGKRREVEL